MLKGWARYCGNWTGDLPVTIAQTARPFCRQVRLYFPSHFEGTCSSKGQKVVVMLSKWFPKSELNCFGDWALKISFLWIPEKRGLRPSQTAELCVWGNREGTWAGKAELQAEKRRSRLVHINGWYDLGYIDTGSCKWHIQAAVFQSIGWFILVHCCTLLLNEIVYNDKNSDDSVDYWKAAAVSIFYLFRATKAWIKSDAIMFYIHWMSVTHCQHPKWCFGEFRDSWQSLKAHLKRTFLQTSSPCFCSPGFTLSSLWMEISCKQDDRHPLRSLTQKSKLSIM